MSIEMRRMASIRWCLVVLLMSLAIAPFSISYAKPGVIGVVYPSVSGPAKRVVENIVDGIKANHYSVETNEIGKNSSHDISGWVKEKDIGVIIAIGRSAYAIASKRGLSKQVILAGTLVEHGGDAKPGIALNPDPKLVLNIINQISPGIRRVSIVYEGDDADWLIDRANEAANELGIKLNAKKANGLNDASKKYRSIFENAVKNKDAIWIPAAVGVAESRFILPMILEEGWKRGVLVCSDTMSHVEKGALFAVYPSEEELGKSLALMAAKALDNENVEFQFLNDVNIALNKITQKHLGLTLSKDKKLRIKIVFPGAVRR